ncbi:RHS repeat-associated core domain-containing protein [Pseudomonas sp. LB3P31]
MLGVDHKNSVISEIDKTERKDINYTAYGHRGDEASVTGQLGFNGERREAQTGWYLLGNGYRAFSPVLMRFNAPDSLSPFGVGGRNAYAYCEGDSINNVDPSGHIVSPWQVFQAFIKSNPTMNTNNKRYAAKVASAEFHKSSPGTPAADAANSRLEAANIKLQSKASGNQSRPLTPKPDYDSDSSSSLAGGQLTGRTSVTSTASNPVPVLSRPAVSGGKPTATSSKATPTVAPRRAAPKNNPNAEKIAEVQAQLKAAKGVRHAYMLDEPLIRRLTQQIADLRTG